MREVSNAEVGEITAEPYMPENWLTYWLWTRVLRLAAQLILPYLDVSYNIQVNTTDMFIFIDTRMHNETPRPTDYNQHLNARYKVQGNDLVPV